MSAYTRCCNCGEDDGVDVDTGECSECGFPYQLIEQLKARVKDLEAELAMINAEYKDSPESQLTQDGMTTKCRALETENKRLRDAQYTSEILCYWRWEQERMEYSTSCLFGIRDLVGDHCPMCGKIIKLLANKGNKPTEQHITPNRAEGGAMAKGKNKGSCGGTPKNNGSGGGKGNKGTPRQPKK